MRPEFIQVQIINRGERSIIRFTFSNKHSEHQSSEKVWNPFQAWGGGTHVDTACLSAGDSHFRRSLFRVLLPQFSKPLCPPQPLTCSGLQMPLITTEHFLSPRGLKPERPRRIQGLFKNSRNLAWPDLQNGESSKTEEKLSANGQHWPWALVLHFSYSLCVIPLNLNYGYHHFPLKTKGWSGGTKAFNHFAEVS